MHSRNMSKSRKAISPILATLLLIVIAVAAIVVTYAWIMTYMTSAGQQAGVRLYKENVSFYGTPTSAARNRVDVTVGNSGTSNTNILRIYIGNSTTNLKALYSNDTGVPLNAGAATTITITWPNILANTWELGKTYYFKIVSSTGQYIDFPEQAPQTS